MILAALAFAWFLWQTPPGIDWLDAGELAGAAFGLGVSHPPGQPLHALLGRLAACLPFGEVAFRLAVLSALTGALTVWGTQALARALLPKARATPVFAALLVLASPLLLGQSARLEVYAPLACATTWGAVFAVRWLRGDRAPADALAAAFCFALAAGLQPLSALAAALPLAVSLAVRAPLSLTLRAVGFGVLALGVYLYLPLRWGADPAPLVLWADRRGFLSFVSGTAYQHNFDLAGLGGRLGGHLMLLGEGPGLALLVLGTAGLLFGTLTGLTGAGALLVCVPLICATGAVQRTFHPANPDIHGYLLPAVPLLGAGVAALLSAAERALSSVRAAPRLVHLPGLALVLFLAAAGPTVHVGALGSRHRDDARRFAAETAFRLPPGPALFLATSDHALFPALYEQAVAGERPDVALAGDQLLESSWHLASLARALPELRYVPDPDRTVAAAPIAGGELPRGRFPASPLGWGYRYADVPADPAPPPRFEGALGERIAAFIRIDRRALWRELPRRTPVFVFEDWQLELMWREGLPPVPVRADAPYEVRLFAAWKRVLAGELDAAAGLDADGLVATAQLLLRRQRTADALTVLGHADPADAGPALLEAAIRANAGELERAAALLGRFPDTPRALAQLGLLHAKRGDLAEAHRLWTRSLALDPHQADVRAWLSRLATDEVRHPARNP